ncbi:MAG: lactate utilization protein [Clostridiales bacterium]|nr:lactate utilization protein [Clostridiales bacterium]
MDEIVRKTMENLNKNNMAAYYVETKEEVVPLIKTLVPAGSVVANGGSESLKQCKVMELLESGYYDFADRRGLEGEDVRNIYIKAFASDAFFCSSNAVTENGEFYNVDGNSNRVACIVYGPRRVIMVVGVNKIVPDLEAAIKRVKEKAAPLNTQRLDCKTPCAKTGKCISLLSEDSEMCAGCESETHICCNYVVSAHQRHKNRIKVIFVNEEIGY